MLDGTIGIGRWGVHTFGMFIKSLLAELEPIKLRSWGHHSYWTWLSAGEREVFEREDS